MPRAYSLLGSAQGEVFTPYLIDFRNNFSSLSSFFFSNCYSESTAYRCSEN